MELLLIDLGMGSFEDPGATEVYDAACTDDRNMTIDTGQNKLRRKVDVPACAIAAGLLQWPR